MRRTARSTASACAVTVMLAVSALAGAEFVKAQSRAQGLVISGPAEYTTSKSAEAGEMDAALARAVGSMDTHGAVVSVAVLDTVTGDGGVYGRGAYDTASIVKVDILAALLLQAQEAGRSPTDEERGYAAAMIGRGDDGATTALWNGIGGAPGLDAANQRLGLTGTRGGPGGMWGLTRTTAADQVTLLRAVFGDDSELNVASQKYAQGLLDRAAPPNQGWGVSEAADDASRSAAKNGLMQRTSTQLWDINSIGRVEADGRGVLIAVLSSGNASRATGTSLVGSVAQTAVQAILSS
ncbi:class A beta-lactamase-related serine hydrolase [Streptomyces sp. RB6PN25]|uniref:Class A beta-lactamase-related serine hydrolase n=1 Tax=Streptomyces humicola TaxID=2953240 RepID=A0ABT1PYD6_9ACTN|nr:class A beta-lactamase-related serine hydrolase [Streptomyces humicola]MCQ4082682.1 class A beta-lactamase-related serine hydrolase [Streptomyces humicola]